MSKSQKPILAHDHPFKTEENLRVLPADLEFLRDCPNLDSYEELLYTVPRNVTHLPAYDKWSELGDRLVTPWRNVDPTTYKPHNILISKEKDGKAHKKDADGLNPAVIDFKARWPEEFRKIAFIQTADGNIVCGQDGAPLCPWFATLVINRGNLRFWGPQVASDGIIFVKENDRNHYFLGVRRDDAQKSIALTGGWQNFYAEETGAMAASREVYEETGGKGWTPQGPDSTANGHGAFIAPHRFSLVFPKYPCWREPRTTDGAYIFTDVYSSVVSIREAQEWSLTNETDMGSAKGAALFRLTEQNIKRTFHHHGDLIRMAAFFHGINVPRR